jgi:hypothetical protein
MKQNLFIYLVLKVSFFKLFTYIHSYLVSYLKRKYGLNQTRGNIYTLKIYFLLNVSKYVYFVT